MVPDLEFKGRTLYPQGSQSAARSSTWVLYPLTPWFFLGIWLSKNV